MRLVTYCNPVKGSDFTEDLKFVAIAALFFKRVYPDGEVICATCGDLPAFLKESVAGISFPFDKEPFARARANFLRQYVGSNSLLTEPTIFTGRDVILLNSLDEATGSSPVVTNYRFNPAMPYCADFIYVNPVLKGAREEAIRLFNSFYLTHCYMPKTIQDFWADQLSWAAVMSMPSYDQFNGQPFFAPRAPFVKVLPADPWFYTPKDCFPTKFSDLSSSGTFDDSLEFVPSNYQYLLSKKYMLHFKGPRKSMMFEFSRWSIQSGVIKPEHLFPNAPDGYFDLQP